MDGLYLTRLGTNGSVENCMARVRIASLLHLPLRGLLKSVELYTRLKDAEQTADMSDAALAYLRTLPAHQLEEYVPRFDPTTGQPILATPRQESS